MVRAADLAGGTAIYSRLELSEERELDGFSLNAVSSVATVPGRGDFRLFALHPIPPTHPEVWAREMEQIASILHAVPTTLPVIALGDFNSTSDHRQFRRLLQRGYRDAGEVAGAGWLPTYPMDKSYPAVVGIDHVLIRGLSADGVRSIDIPNTDHRAVLARVG